MLFIIHNENDTHSLHCTKTLWLDDSFIKLELKLSFQQHDSNIQKETCEPLKNTQSSQVQFQAVTQWLIFCIFIMAYEGLCKFKSIYKFLDKNDKIAWGGYCKYIPSYFLYSIKKIAYKFTN